MPKTDTSKSNPANLIALAQKEYDQQKAELDAKLAKKNAELLKQVKNDLSNAFGEVLNIYNVIPTEHRKEVLKEPAFELVLNSLGLEVILDKVKKARKPRTTAAKVSDDEIIAYLGEEKLTGDVQKKFGLSAVTIGSRLKTLHAANKV